MSARFDDIVRGKLDGARHAGAPDWEALSDALEGEAFDEALSSRLTAATAAAVVGVPAGAALPDWNSLSAKLDADAAASGDAFDALISRRVGETTSDLDPTASWRQLSHRIDTLWPLRKRLARYRVLEIAAAVLFLVTFLPLLGDEYRQTTPRGPMVSVEPPLGSFESPTSKASPAYSPVNNLLGALGLREVELSVRAPEEIAALYGRGDGRQSLGYSSSPPGQERTPSFVREDTLGTSQRAIELNVVHDGDGMPPEGADGASALSLWSPLAMNSVRPRAVSSLSTSNGPTLVIPVPSARDNPWSFGADAGMRVWQITTPIDESFGRAGSTQRARATQLSAHVLRDLGPRWRLGLSLATASATYDTGLPEVRRRAFVTAAGYDLTEDFRGIDLDIAQATADLRFGLLSAAGPLQVWAKAGVGANAFVRTAYDLQREEVVAFSFATAPSFSGVESQSTKPSVERAYVPTEEKYFTEGLLQGGALTSTTQAFGRLGIEAELALDGPLRAFGAVDYDFAIPGQAGFGPNRDRFGAFGISFGARISL